MRILLPLVVLFVFSACDTQSKEKALALNGFDWANKKVIELQPELNEISGIAYDSKRHCMLAINDEQGILFVLNPDNYLVERKLKFAKKGDYEAVSTDGEKVWVLKSNGDVYTMSWCQDSIGKALVSSYPGPVAEFETGFWDSRQKVLKMVSKKSEADKASQANHIYTLDPATGTYLPDSNDKISWENLRTAGLKSKAFHPSDAAVQPGTGDIYVLASIEKLLVIFKADWSAPEIHQLDEQLFRQPEGITFDQAGNLLITNEAADAKPTIIFIPVKK